MGRPWWSRIWNRLPARRFQFLLDVTVLSGAFLFAYLLRFDFDVPRPVLHDALLLQLPLVAFIQFLALSKSGVYTFIWRYISLRDLHAFVAASLFSAVPILALRLGLPDQLASWRVPISVIIVDTGLAFGGVLGLRLLRRMLYERYEKRRLHPIAGTTKKATLLIGAGRAGVLAAGEILGRDDMQMDVRGFVDDDVQKAGAVINGVKVLGTTKDLSRVCQDEGIEQVVITIARPSREVMEYIVRTCEIIRVKVRVIPGLFEILRGAVGFTRIRDVEIEDLLGRQPVELDVQELGEFLSGRVVMVTGAGGSIGAELVRQAAAYRPSRVLLVERAEPALFHIHREITKTFEDIEFVPLLADISDMPRMDAIFEQHKPQLILHAAAHKHVPLMEANPFETIKNNVFGTMRLGELAGNHGAEGFVFISTDKAVNPTSMMGASKRVAELVVLSLNRRFAARYVAVRFGNVLGSNGSVIPIFREQIKRGGPVTVTHPDMKRYFMTIPEASQLVLQAGAMGRGGEIYVLDMGDEVRIVDLAERMIALSGLRPYDDIDIVFSGLRPGEKLFEELSTEAEDIAKTRHPKIFIGNIAPCGQEELTSALDDFVSLGSRNDESGLRLRLSQLLPEATLEGVPVPKRSEKKPRRVKPHSGEFAPSELIG